jgi:hypothetical protein
MCPPFTADFNGLDLICDILKKFAKQSTLLEALVEQGCPGVNTFKGVYDHGGRSEAKIPRKRARLLFGFFDYLENINRNCVFCSRAGQCWLKVGRGWGSIVNGRPQATFQERPQHQELLFDHIQLRNQVA